MLRPRRTDVPPAQRARARLIEATLQGGITLVLGAGVSLPRGLPSWGRLVGQLWAQTFADEPLPKDATGLPQFLPLALDLISRKVGGERFTELLRQTLYEKVALLDRGWLASSDETLAVIARLLVQQRAQEADRRLLRVISFNVDDLVERAVKVLAPPQRTLKPIARASHHPERGRGEQALPIYHLHGFLPQEPERRWHQDAGDSLVFTDSQYWSSVASPMSFANRVMSFALHDSRCVFIGCSMTDINVLRWLAVRANEIEADKETQFQHHPDGADGSRSRRAAQQAVQRHFWIRPDTDDAQGFLGRCLAIRGVHCVPIDSWTGSSFRELVAQCFP